jgi:predicted porin
MKKQRIWLSTATAVVLAGALAPAAQAFDVAAGDWKLSVSGNVNAHFIYQMCQTTSTASPVDGGLACVAADNSSSVSNGLLPAALSVSGSTTQAGWDLGFTFGLYPGISTNDGGSPNLQATPGPTHTALGTAGLDVRQVFLTFGNSSFGTVMAGRNIGLFQADAILNDMTLLGVGGGNGTYAAPPNTSLGSIGLGYIYTDWIAQIDYTTPDIAGTKVTIGVFDPLNTLGQPVPTNKKAPGVHAKVAYKAGPLYLSASGLVQQQRGTTGVLAGTDYNSWGADIGGMFDFAGFQVAGWYYRARGLGTTGLFVLSDDGAGHPRDSEGFLAQVTYKLGPTKFGLNYGMSKLYSTGADFTTLFGTTGLLVSQALVLKNDKFTAGVYHSLTDNLLLLAEFTNIRSENQIGRENNSRNVNVGAFLKF